MEDDAAVAAGRFGGEEAPPRHLRDRGECLLPTPIADFEVEEALGDPLRIGAQSPGALGKRQCRCAIVRPQGVVQQAAQTEKFGFRPLEHRREEVLCGVFVAFELCGLRRQQQRQRRIGEERAGAPGMATRRLGLASGDRDHPLAQGPVTGPAPALLTPAANGAWAPEDGATEPKQQRQGANSG